MYSRQSINQRALLAAGLILMAFLGMAGLVLDRAFRASAEEAIEQRLEAYLYGLLAVADLTPSQSLSIPNFMTDERFNRPGSGLYAVIVDDQKNSVWQSRSSLGTDLPAFSRMTTGLKEFQRAQAAKETLFLLSYGVEWELENNQSRKFNFHIISSLQTYNAQVSEFRRSLWGWLAAVALLLLAAQLTLLRWSLSPLRDVANDLHAVESGQQVKLTGEYPRELSPLTGSINHLLQGQQKQLQRYRNALADLAHSLKTPLAVIRDTTDSQTIQAQTDRMKQIVDYQLQRAATAGHAGLGTRTLIQPTIKRLIESLQKVYADKGLNISIDIPADVEIAMDEGDLMELTGNLLDNACKWANNSIQLSAQYNNDQISLIIEDDGPGIANDVAEEILQRGRRADCAIEGQGIGLAVVTDIAQTYGGELSILDSKSGGAKLTFSLPTAVN